MGKGPLRFFQTKVAMALIGAILIGGTSAVLAARTVNEGSLVQTTNALTANSNSTTASQLATSTSTTNAVQATATAQATAGGSGGGGNQPTPTTPVIPPTRVPTPTPAVGQTETYSGTVSNITGSTFVVGRTSPHTIDVNGSTAFTGAATSFSALQSGMHAQVTCTVQVGGSCLASTVASTVNN